MARTTRKTRESGDKGFPTVKLGDTEVPDVLQLRKSGMKWADITSLTKMPRNKLEPLIWKLEPIADPSLKFEPTPENIASARMEDNLRWERIAARTGLGVAKAKSIFEEETGFSAETHFVGKGRRFIPMVGGPKARGYKDLMEFDPKENAWVPKDGAKATTPRRTRKRRTKAA